MPVVPTLHVVPLVTTRALAGALDYLAPEGAEPLAVGTMVRAPLGSRVVDGVVIGAGEADSEGLRHVSFSERPSVPPDLVELALWIAAYYGSTPARALTLVLPPRVAPASEAWAVARPLDDAPAARAESRGHARRSPTARAGWPSCARRPASRSR